MFEYEHEKVRREKIYKIFTILFIIIGVLNIFLGIKELLNGATTILRFTLMLLGHIFVIYLCLRRNVWMLWLIIFTFVLQLLLLILYLLKNVAEWIN